MISITTCLICLFIVLFLVGIILHAIIAPDLQDYKNMKKRQVNESKIELQHSGGGLLYFPPTWDVKKNGNSFNYDIRSWDGGKIWYAVEIDTNCVDGLWGIKILGRANELYPGLVKHIESWNVLTKYVKKYGSISPNDPEGIKLLENVGATVEIDALKTK